MAAILVVATGRAIITNRLRGAGTEPLNLGWATGTQTTTLDADTNLGPTMVEKDVDLSGAGPNRTVGTSSQVTTTTTNDTYQVVALRTATGAGTVVGAALFDATSGGNMFLKGDFTGIGLSATDAINFTAKAKFA